MCQVTRKKKWWARTCFFPGKEDVSRTKLFLRAPTIGASPISVAMTHPYRHHVGRTSSILQPKKDGTFSTLRSRTMFRIFSNFLQRQVQMSGFFPSSLLDDVSSSNRRPSRSFLSKGTTTCCDLQCDRNIHKNVGFYCVYCDSTSNIERSCRALYMYWIARITTFNAQHSRVSETLNFSSHILDRLFSDWAREVRIELVYPLLWS